VAQVLVVILIQLAVEVVLVHHHGVAAVAVWAVYLALVEMAVARALQMLMALLVMQVVVP
jgi:hypothetical protein